MFKVGLLVAALAICVLWVNQGQSFPAAQEDGETNSTLSHNSTTNKRVLTPEENDLANAARAHIAKVLERNLIRLFAAITVQQRQSRQEEGGGGDDEDEDSTFNPNTLPQVAQLLGAIFSGNLNLTSVVDQAFYLVPQTVRNQVTGIFKLLGGQTTEEPETGDAAVLNATKPVRRTRPPRPTLPPATTESAPDAAPFFPPASVQQVNSQEDSSPPRKIKVKPTWKSVTIPTPSPVPEEDINLQDDELNPVEQELVTKAKEYAPYAVNKEPRFFLNSIQQFFRTSNVNLTQVVRVMPDLFKGARQAFILLDELGVLPDDIFPGLDADDEDD